MKIDLDLLDTAYHEAGHAVVAIALGRLLEDICVTGPEEGWVRLDREQGLGLSERLEGAQSNSWNLEEPPWVAQCVREDLMFHVAGFVAEYLWNELEIWWEWPPPPGCDPPGCDPLDVRLSAALGPRWRS